MADTRIQRHTATAAVLMLVAGLLGFLDVEFIPSLLGFHVALASSSSFDAAEIGTLLPMLAALVLSSAGRNRRSTLTRFVLRAGAARAQFCGCVLAGLCIAAAAHAMDARRGTPAHPVAGFGYLVFATSTVWRIADESLHAAVANIARDNSVWTEQQSRIAEFREEATSSMKRGLGRLTAVAVGYAAITFGLDIGMTAATHSGFGDLPIAAFMDIALSILVGGFVLSTLMIDVLTRIYNARAMRVLFASLSAAVPTAVLINCLRLGEPDASRALEALAFALALITPWTYSAWRWRHRTTGHRRCEPVRSLAIRLACAHAIWVGTERQKTRDELERAAQSR